MHYVPTSSVSAKLLNSAKAQFEFLINQYFPEAGFYAKEIFTIRLWFWNMNIEVILLHVLYIVHFYLETVSLDQLSHCDSLLLSVFVPVYRALTVFRPAIRYKKITSFFFNKFRIPYLSEQMIFYYLALPCHRNIFNQWNKCIFSDHMFSTNHKGGELHNLETVNYFNSVYRLQKKTLLKRMSSGNMEYILFFTLCLLSAVAGDSKLLFQYFK